MNGHKSYRSLNKAKVVESYSERKVILGLVFDSIYLDRAYDSLLDQCKKGKLAGVATQLSTSLGFFSWTDKIRMKAYCVKS
jgi:hypothetical protein